MWDGLNELHYSPGKGPEEVGFTMQHCPVENPGHLRTHTQGPSVMRNARWNNST